MGKLIVERKGQYNGALRDAAILIDDKKVGVVGNGKTFEAELSPGRHVLRARMDWIRSPPINIEALADSDVRVGLSLCPAWLALFALLGLIPYLRARQL